MGAISKSHRVSRSLLADAPNDYDTRRHSGSRFALAQVRYTLCTACCSCLEYLVFASLYVPIGDWEHRTIRWGRVGGGSLAWASLPLTEYLKLESFSLEFDAAF